MTQTAAHAMNYMFSNLVKRAILVQLSQWETSKQERKSENKSAGAMPFRWPTSTESMQIYKREINAKQHSIIDKQLCSLVSWFFIRHLKDL